MKRFVTLVAVLLLTCPIWGQAQLTTRKYKFNDFTEKTTKVVLTGNMFYDSALKEEIANRWRLSPYEFCTIEEFEEIKTDSNFYFLLTTSGQFKKEKMPGIVFLSLVKGGNAATKGIHKMLEVTSIPLCPAENPTGREFVFLPAFIDILQNYTRLSMENDYNAYMGLSSSASNLSSRQKAEYRLLMQESDLSASLPEKFLKRHKNDIIFVEEEEIDDAMLKGAHSTLVSYVVYPENPDRSSCCYKMVIDTETHDLFYFKKSKITKVMKPGFLEGDIKRITDALK